ncbi:alpha/beta-hydrolase [Schizopora paradoxa]|uniref:Alpha/beta-hydrolase n=1 Tax=Schizopora paradoxa TaxID=27342 RepID=A0A0H2RQH1_9AGAM|nr:alpha/beta-hydrolase [Schizopora paradoxa]
MSPALLWRRALFGYAATTRNIKPHKYKGKSRSLQSLVTASLASQPSPNPPSISLALAVVVGLPLALWTYKCVALVLFQRKIIYMGYAPPGARSEYLEDIANQIPQDVCATRVELPSSKGVLVHGLVLTSQVPRKPDCVLIYFQGNAGNPLHRIPVFTTLLGACKKLSLSPAILAPAPRSYWTSTNRTPTQQGIIADYLHAIEYASERWPGVPLVLYGHSLGGAVATYLLAAFDDEHNVLASRVKGRCLPMIRGLILENPFSSIPDMVREMYPQRWLPYRYLAPLAWDKWDALRALRETKPGSVLHEVTGDALVIVSEKDEVVPRSMGEAMFSAMESRDPDTGSDSVSSEREPRLLVIKDALHENAWMQRQWAVKVARYLFKFRAQETSNKNLLQK